jgi:hypothetical protein
VDVELSLPPLDRSDYLLLHVLDPAGSPFDGAQIEVSYKTPRGGQSSGSGTVVHREKGVYWVLHGEWGGSKEDDGEGTNGVTVSAEGYPQKEVEYRRSETSELTVKLDEPAFAEVVLVGFDPSAIAGRIQVSIESPPQPPQEGEVQTPAARGRRVMRSRGNFSSMQEELSEEGQIIVGPLSPGSYIVMVQSGGGHPVARQEVTLGPGKNRVEVPFPRLSSLTVRLPGASADSHLQIEPLGGDGDGRYSFSARVGRDGAARFHDLPPGEYRLRLFGGGESADMTVSLPGQAEVTFQAARHDAMLVRITDPEGRMAKAGVLDGDVIVSLEGEAFASQREWQDLVQRHIKDKEIRLGIVRAGGEVEVSVSPRRLQEGATLEPATR